MSTQYRIMGDVPTSVIVERLKELSNAICKNRMNEFTMSIPAELDRDADLILVEAARRLDELSKLRGISSHTINY